MTDLLNEQDDAATPFSVEEHAELIPSYITLRQELNEAEQANILDAERWAFARQRDVFNEQFLSCSSSSAGLRLCASRLML